MRTAIPLVLVVALALTACTPDDTVLSDCAIELSADAQASAIASAWVVPSSPLSCIFRVN